MYSNAPCQRLAAAVARRAILLSSRRVDLEDDILAKGEPIEGLSDEERALLGDALRALRLQRGKAWNAACDAAEAAGKRRPSLRPYGIDAIKRLARRLGVGPTYWTGEY